MGLFLYSSVFSVFFPLFQVCFQWGYSFIPVRLVLYLRVCSSGVIPLFQGMLHWGYSIIPVGLFLYSRVCSSGIIPLFQGMLHWASQAPPAPAGPWFLQFQFLDPTHFKTFFFFITSKLLEGCPEPRQGREEQGAAPGCSSWVSHTQAVKNEDHFLVNFKR